MQPVIPAARWGVLSSSGNLDIRLSGQAKGPIRSEHCSAKNPIMTFSHADHFLDAELLPDRPSFDLHTDVCIKKRLACVTEYPVSCQDNFVGLQEGRRSERKSCRLWVIKKERMQSQA